MQGFWRKIKQQPVKIGIVCVLIIGASGLLVGGNVLAMQSAENLSVSNNHDDKNVAEDILVNGQYFFSSDFDNNSDKGVYMSVLLTDKNGELLNRYLKDSETGGVGVLGGAQRNLTSVTYNDFEIPQLPLSFFNGNDANFYMPGRLMQGNLPENDSEVAISEQAAESYNWKVGDVVVFNGKNDESYSISGIWGVPEPFFSTKYSKFIEQYVDIPFIISDKDISFARTYTIDEIPLDATIVTINKETGEAMYLQPHNDQIDFFDEENKAHLYFEKTDENTYAIANGGSTTHRYWTIYIDNPEHARQFYVELQDILAD